MRLIFGVLALSTALTTAGAVTRQALHLDDGPLIGWRCPDCRGGNAGDPEATFHAVCRQCERRFAWDDVVVVTGSGRLAGRMSHQCCP
jgi:hypothetical protein